MKRLDFLVRFALVSVCFVCFIFSGCGKCDVLPQEELRTLKRPPLNDGSQARSIDNEGRMVENNIAGEWGPVGGSTQIKIKAPTDAQKIVLAKELELRQKTKLLRKGLSMKTVRELMVDKPFEIREHSIVYSPDSTEPELVSSYYMYLCILFNEDDNLIQWFWGRP
jgi:hypothetical protein